MAPHTLKLLYRADGGRVVGTGHLLRAARVLSALRSRVALDATLALAEDAGGAEYARQSAARVVTLPASRAQGAKPAFAPDVLHSHVRVRSFDVVIVDMLDSPRGALSEIRSEVPALITLDDRGPGRMDADGIINFLVREPEPDRLRRTRLYEGPAYATLDPVYEHASARHAREDSRGAHVMVSVGGGDAAGLSVKIARALQSVGGLAEVVFACGAAYGHEAELRTAMSGSSWQGRILQGIPHLKDVFELSDLAIVAGGMTMHEALRTGTPAVAVCQPIDHQLELAQQFEAIGAMRSVGDGTRASEADISACVRNLLQDRDAMDAMRRVGPTIVDGRGTARTASAILEIVASAQRR